MKQGGIFCVCLVLVLMLCVPVFAQPNNESVETINIDTFDSEADMNWVWKTQAGKTIYVGKDADGNEDKYPKLGYFEGCPNPLKAYRTSDDPTAYVLGVQAKFNHRGDNWFEVYPSNKDTGKPYEIQMKGTVSQFDFWVWGANYNYILEMIIRDAYGTVHVLPVSIMNFSGWKNVVVEIPSSIRQQSKLRSGPENINFIGFRVRSTPNEFVDDFVIYFDRLRYTTNTLNTIYDGFELRKFDNAGKSSEESKNEGAAK